MGLVISKAEIFAAFAECDPNAIRAMPLYKVGIVSDKQKSAKTAQWPDGVVGYHVCLTSHTCRRRSRDRASLWSIFFVPAINFLIQLIH